MAKTLRESERLGLFIFLGNGRVLGGMSGLFEVTSGYWLGMSGLFD
ncbi:hypothetical protein ABE021_12760 [Sporosarcina gallistercoris]